MDYVALGDTGMKVSRICLGCMSLGLDSSAKYDWSLGEERSRAIVERAIDLGITFFDTSNTYSWGDSERVLGSVLSEHDRDEMVIATKVSKPPSSDPHPNATGLSRKTIEQELDDSLERLGVDTIDLYQTHRLDARTPIEETLRALTDSVRRGKVRYIGGSSMWAYQFAEALHAADQAGLERFVSMQNHYNLVYREEEREMLPLCETEGIGVIPWSPLARGYLTRPHEEFGTTSRGRIESNSYVDRHGTYRDGGGEEINERVRELAERKGVSMAQVSLAWQFHKAPVTAPVVGVTSVDNLDDAVEALDVSLSRGEVDYLEEPYEPVPIEGHT